MIKVVFCLRRRPDLTREQFFKHWNTRHAELSLKNRKAMGWKRYVQNLTISTAISKAANDIRGGLPEFDGVAEAWFDDLASFERVGEASDGSAMEEMFKDESNFIDLKNSTFFLVEEHEIG